MNGFLLLEDGTVFRGESVGAEGFAFGEAVFTTAMTGYQEVVTDPSYAEQIVCFTAPMVGNYGVAPTRSESARAHARAVVMREARGPAWTDWLAERGVVALSGIDTRSLVLHLREARRMRAIAIAGEASVDEALASVRAQPPMAGRALAATVSTREPYVFSDAGRGADRGRRLRLQALDPAPARVGRRRGHRLSRTTSTPTSSARYDGVLLSNGPGDPEPARGEIATRARTCSDACRCSGSASATSCSRSRPATRRSSFRSATAARTIPCSSARAAACSSRARTTASPSRRREAREATHVSLYDGTVEGLDYPELRARSRAVPPGGRARAARRLADPRELGRGGAPCPGGLTSSRSA